MLNAIQGMKLYAHCYHGVELYALCYTTSEAICLLLFME